MTAAPPYDVPPIGYLVADGSAVSRTTYADLFAVYGTSFGVGDGSTTFNLPDVRGRFTRFTDAGAGRDGDAATRTPKPGGGAATATGSTQLTTLRSHTHGFGVFRIAGATARRHAGAGGPTDYAPTTANTGATEMRPTNKSIAGLVKY